tara:strand:+ start:952 stop:1191 length:240 start_codon:yes stop_codon:yes gene_type:complete
MAKYRAVVDLMYPTPATLKIVIKAGGISKLSVAQRERVTLKNVNAGALCDDIPEKSIKGLLAKGSIKEVAPTAKKPKRR